jgi:hypothetical protein
MTKPLAPVLLLAAAIFLALASGPALAQSAVNCEIKKLEAALIPSPQTESSYSKESAQGEPSPWLEIDVEIDIPQPTKNGPKLGEDLTVNYYILLNNKSLTEDGKATLLTGSVSHAEYLFGKGLHVGAFVAPQTLLKFFDGEAPRNFNQAIIDIGVTISDSTGIIARKASESQVRGDKGWWDSTEKFTEVTGRVLAKSDTPFADLSWDYYLPEKPKSGL